MTQSPAPSTRSALSTGRWVALVVVLGGLFGMHGLAGHGSHAADMGTTDPIVTTSTASVTVVAEHAVMTTDPAAQAASDLSGVVSGAGAGGAMTMLCLAVLTAGALLLWLARQPTRRPLARAPSPAPSRLLGSGRDPDPPSLTALSIRRC